MSSSSADGFVDHLARWRDRLENRIGWLAYVLVGESRGHIAKGTLRALAESADAGAGLVELVDREDAKLEGALLRAFPGGDGRVDSAFTKEAIGSACDRADAEPIEVELLGRVYERLVAGSGARKSGGVYYTPSWIVVRMIETAVEAALTGHAAPCGATLTMLDPACGAGSFLLGALRYIAARSGDAPLDVARRCLFGVDIDARAVEVTRLSLWLEASPKEGDRRFADLAANVRCGDSLVDASFDYRAAFPQIFAEGGFDVVVGNPPYVSFGGRQAVDLGAADRRYFERHYRAGGWAAAHSLFMERAARLLSRRVVSFIVPDQVGHLAGYRSLREVLAESGRITQVKYWGEDVFAGVVTPSLSFVLDKSAVENAPPTRIVDADDSEHVVRIARGSPWTASSAQQLLEKLAEGSFSIRPFLADCGLRTTDAREQVVKLGDARGQFVPVLEGKQIGRYRCAPPEVGVRLDTRSRVFMSRPEKYAGARFLIRQTAPYPVVGPREHATYFRNSLHALYPPGGDIDMRYVVGLLNSKLLRFAYVAMVRESKQRVFPQVKLAPLGALPFRAVRSDDPDAQARYARIVELVTAMLELKRKPCADGEANDAARVAADELDLSIDSEVFALYRLSDAEIAQVETTVGALAPAP